MEKELINFNYMVKILTCDSHNFSHLRASKHCGKGGLEYIVVSRSYSKLIIHPSL